MTTATLPHWDVSTVFPSLESPEFAAEFATVQAQVNDLRAQWDAANIDRQATLPVDDATVATFEHATTALNATLARYSTLRAYIHAFISTDATNTTAQARDSELEAIEVTLEQLTTRFTAWIGSLDVAALIARSTVAAEHAFALQKAQVSAAHQMSPAEEALAAELSVTGAGAWGKFYANTTSRMVVPLTQDGQTHEVPMTLVRNMAFAPDRATRKAGYLAELAAWERHAEPLAAALNSIKGQTNTLTRRRGWATPLDEALFTSGIDRATFDALMGAAHEAFPDFRRYFDLKARALGIPKLAFYDLFAPVGSSDRSWSYPDATAFVVEQFGVYSPRLSDFAARAFRENWIDAEPRAGKRGGAFCMALRGDESRVLTNYDPSYEGVSTIAHELGHGYHNLNLAQRTPLQRQTPMTLAETASIFCETLTRDAALRNASQGEQMLILESVIGGAAQVVVDITSRFLFEQHVFERRQTRELSVAELCEIMLDAQRATYGDGLDDTQLHPYMWAAKGHYYRPDIFFYNYPYMFGLLFGLGLYAHYQRDAAAFRGQYDDLLSSTGLADAASLAARFGIDIHSPAFWRSSLDVIRADITRFGELVQQSS
ncbi:MAG: M3 family oligoendopeptidase [Ktedonobacterales bacterium]|nr:M3 family oligoendopeptidase [Ktedonobacterales bacterium]